ncbi:MAG: L,D-transpeptidase/peptidoglycan binding protein [Blautia sp.]|nr:L,D-transpeptidase/peptidoglycan binding protein [Blautia sp.]
MRTGRKLVIGLLMLLIFVAAGVYIAGRIVFQYHFFPGTTINGMDCSLMTVEEAESLIDREIKTYALAVDTMYHGREAITAKEIGMGYEPDGTVENLLKNQNITAWFTHLTGRFDHTAESIIGISDGMLSWAVDSLDCMQDKNVTYPSDAHIVIEDDDTFTVVPEVEGNALDWDKAREVIRNAVFERKSEVNLEEEGCYLKPSITSDSQVIEESLTRLQNYKDAWITYDFADSTETLDWNTIRDWVTTDAEGYSTLDEEKVRGYVKGLAEKYNTYGTDRSFLTYDNRTININDAEFGWIIDEDKETQELMQVISEGTVDVREPVYSQSGGSRVSTDDLGMTYIEIDLMYQRLVYYEEGKPLVDTSVISGSPQYDYMTTPTGIFKVAGKNTASEISVDGMNRNVNYALELNNALYICDAPWRTEFGDDVYFWEGTEGSVLVPTDAMASLFSYADEGTPVVIYDEGRIR